MGAESLVEYYMRRIKEMSDAERVERMLLNEVSIWYETGRRKDDFKLIQHMSELI